MLAAATSLFARTSLSQNYTIASPNSTPAPPASGLPSASSISPFHVGPWKIQQASHKVTGKRVSVWTVDKRSQEMDKLGAAGRDRVLEVLKAEASALGRLRHPSILEMVEPVEETRSELTFATEPVLSVLASAIPTGAQSHQTVELDEIEIQKGVLQLSKGLSFLHTSAKLIHSNVTPWSILINAAGDWKLSGLGMTIPLTTPDGKPTRWEFPTFDTRQPAYTQRSSDYMAPEYAIDEQLVTATDMYALGCVLYAVHNKGSPPFRNHGSLSTLRNNVGSGVNLTGMERWDRDLQSLLTLLITRTPASRPTPSTLPSHPFFNSLPVSTLNFLDRSTFASKPREEKIAFMKGLTSVLDRFSDGLRTRKILPSLLEEMKDPFLLPSILPNVFSISTSLSPSQFAALVLPSLKPLFVIKDPPQNMITLLDNLSLLQGKTDKTIFREHVLPLVYNALESEHAIVQERALKVVPDLCETIDYAEVQGVLFPRVALVFTKTRILSVKVSTLVCFLSMVKTLDQSSLTQKLVPLLAKIRTKEPAVMLATLAVHEAMGLKVDREAVATLVLPQLWTMSMGPLLNVEQFARFMSVIRALGDRVEKEHNQYLRDSQRVEDRSGGFGTNDSAPLPAFSAGKDFESLVGGGSNGSLAAVPLNGSTNTGTSTSTGWEDDVWGSILNSGLESPTPQQQQPLRATSSPFVPPQTQSLPGTPKPGSRPTLGSRTLGTKPLPLNATSSPPTSRNSLSSMTLPPPPSNRSTTTPLVPKPNYNNNLPTQASSLGNFTQPSLQPQQAPISSLGLGIQQQKPNYNITLPSVSNPGFSNTASSLSYNTGSLLSPGAPAASAWSGTTLQPKKATKDDWGDFDPLS